MIPIQKSDFMSNFATALANVERYPTRESCIKLGIVLALRTLEYDMDRSNTMRELLEFAEGRWS